MHIKNQDNQYQNDMSWKAKENRIRMIWQKNCSQDDSFSIHYRIKASETT